MCDVVIAADNDPFAFCTLRIASCKQCIIEAELEWHTLVLARAIREVHVVENEFSEVDLEDAPFAIELFDTDLLGDVVGLDTREHANTAVATLDGTRVEVAVISWNVLELIRNLVDIGLGFLHTDHVGLGLLEPVHEALLLHGANAVDIPTDDLHRPALSSVIVKSALSSNPASRSFSRPPCSRSITQTT